MKMVNFELGNEMWKTNYEHDTNVGQKIWVPNRNWTHDLPNTWWPLFPLNYENSWRESSLNWVHMWQASCTLLGSALSNSSWVVISEWRWWILSSEMKCERWIIQHDTSRDKDIFFVPRSCHIEYFIYHIISLLFLFRSQNSRWNKWTANQSDFFNKYI